MKLGLFCISLSLSEPALMSTTTQVLLKVLEVGVELDPLIDGGEFMIKDPNGCLFHNS
jgi:hypothetical protein